MQVVMFMIKNNGHLREKKYVLCGCTKQNWKFILLFTKCLQFLTEKKIGGWIFIFSPISFFILLYLEIYLFNLIFN